MYLIPVILDWRPAFGNGAFARHSPLTLPLGAGSMLDYLASRLARVADEKPLILPPGPIGPRCEVCLRRSSSVEIGVSSAEALAQRLRTCEASDFLLIVEPRNWPAAGYEFDSIVQDADHYRGATHAIAIGKDAERAWDDVEFDRDGRIRRVRRLYARMSWPDTATTPICWSIVPARAVCDVRLTSLAGLRAQLAAKGVFTRDIPIRSEVYDLGETAGILALSERAIDATMRSASSSGLSLRSRGIWVGQGSRIHPSVRLVEPVLIQDDVTLDDGATVIGPTVIGAGARIGREAVVARSVLGCETIVPPRASLHHGIVPSKCNPAAAARDGSATGRIASMLAAGDDAPHASPSGGSPVANGNGGRRWHFAAKRLLDTTAAAVGLLVLSPVLLAVAALIKLGSPGPVFFPHRRESKGGREFPCIKFRTMVADAHRQQRELYEKNEVDGPQFKLEADPRVTRIGGWLRRTNLDEIPQLINVLAGHMSLVGPRPSPFRENQICVPWRRARLSVRPGITGLWQICRDRRSDGDFHQWIFYDLAYVRHFSFWLDVRILVATLTSRFGRRRVALSRLIPGNGDGHPQVEAAAWPEDSVPETPEAAAVSGGQETDGSAAS